MTSGHNKKALLQQSTRGKEAHTVDDEDDDHENAKRGTKAHSAALVMLSTLGFLIPESDGAVLTSTPSHVRALPEPIIYFFIWMNVLGPILLTKICQRDRVCTSIRTCRGGRLLLSTLFILFCTNFEILKIYFFFSKGKFL